MKRELGKEVFFSSLYDTKRAREIFHLEKDHPEDAKAIATIYVTDHVEPNVPAVYEVRQFRRHNRAIIHSQRERTYRLDSKIIAKNRKPRYEQKGKALSTSGLTRQEISKLTVEKSHRHYNVKDRIMPGEIFRISPDGSEEPVAYYVSKDRVFILYEDK